MKKTILTLLLSLLPVLAFSSGDGYPLEKIETDPTDKASLQRGAALFQNNCQGCHATGFQRYERVADDLGIPHDLMMENLSSIKTPKLVISWLMPWPRMSLKCGLVLHRLI